MDDPWPFALSKARIGSLVQRRPFIGVQGAPMYPPYYGFIVDIIAVEKCNIFEDDFCFAYSKKLDTGSALQVDDFQNHNTNTEFAPGCPVWLYLGCWEPTLH